MHEEYNNEKGTLVMATNTANPWFPMLLQLILFCYYVHTILIPWLYIMLGYFIMMLLLVTVLRKMVKVEGHSPKEVSNVDETGPTSTTSSHHLWPYVNTIYDIKH
jgi:1,4-dihydroxy-2-naphthoate octaprenyltransferase